jgi:hypothetical protein
MCSFVNKKRCHVFADKYIEYDLVPIFIDMVLHKTAVYRHMLYNRIEYDDSGLDVFWT